MPACVGTDGQTDIPTMASTGLVALLAMLTPCKKEIEEKEREGVRQSYTRKHS